MNQHFTQQDVEDFRNRLTDRYRDAFDDLPKEKQHSVLLGDRFNRSFAFHAVGIPHFFFTMLMLALGTWKAVEIVKGWL